MAKIFLTQPDARYRDTFLEGVATLNTRETEGAPNPFTDFDIYMNYLQANARGEQLPNGYVPYTHFWLIDGDTFVARGNLRHELSDFLLNYGGHIGYDVVPEHRGKGYGKEILGLMLPEARKLGIDKILVTCNDKNLASARIIEANGGVLENLVDDKISKIPGEKLRRYWIG